ncbi:fimbria/pilus periplasmic chaperone [Vibrio agarivorans]|uniref:Fimbria/pilus periplasmic chaperone n=1 Tax=Vibrio agarivorans TaxID=153622 RepID=A0ABT7Y1C9_9VIBR|nr:fimbria/pilus periplasmic chaperone [Vibrio agarivorans]MDN2481838.1 fimbria/pilus periplasmic chaperone [Vibrio agarivorans]
MTRGFLWLMLIIPITCKALVIEPLVLEMNHQQQGQIIISNPTAQPLAVDTQVFEIDFAQEGSLLEADNALLVYPPAVLLQPGAKQSIRLIWQGAGTMDHSRSFYVRFTTPKINVVATPSTSRVDVQIDYNALIHIADKQHKPLIAITDQYVESQSLVLKVENQGSGYDSLVNYTLTDASNKPVIAQLADSVGNVFFPPMSTSHLRIPLAELESSFNFSAPLELKRTSLIKD